jgi:hypothetical protein
MCDPERMIPRTWDKILDTLTALNTQGLLPDLSSLTIADREQMSDIGNSLT